MSSIQQVAIFGATGMVGQGVLRSLLADPAIASVYAIGRSPVAETHPKLAQIVRKDLTQYQDMDALFARFDAVFFCLGVSSFGMQEAPYKAINYDTALGAARALHAANPLAPFIYVSARGADITLKSTSMWQRVRGQIDRDLKALSPKIYMVRPAMIMPMHGIVSRTPAYRMLYVLMNPVMGLLRRIRPSLVTTSDELAQAMIQLARHGHPEAIIESGAFAALAQKY